MDTSPQFDNVVSLSNYRSAKNSVDSDIRRGAIPDDKKLVRKNTKARAEALRIADEWVAAGAHRQPPLRKSIRDTRSRLRKTTDWLGLTWDERFD